MKKFDPIADLSRRDKWYLSGNRLQWAPPFPQYLDYPGFWDEASYFNYEFAPLFTWALLDEDGREIPLEFRSRKWRPDFLQQKYNAVSRQRRRKDEQLRLVEQKTILANDVASCLVRLRNRSSKKLRLHFVVWTVQQSFPVKQTSWLSEITFDGETITFVKNLKPADRPQLRIAVSLGMNQAVTSHAISLSQRSALQPHWRFTPFYETFVAGKLPDTVKISSIDNEGLLYFALHTEINLKPQGEKSVVVGLAIAPQTAPPKILPETLQKSHPIKANRESWRSYLSQVPQFQCSDEYFTRYYWYRWYGLRLNTISVQEGNYQHPFVCEGIEYFRAPISYSAMCHMRENRWRLDPALAAGSLLTFLDNQREDGGLRGYIDVNQYRQELFYHADWGNAVLELQRIHPSQEFLAAIYPGLKRYAEYFDRERDAENSGLYDIDNQYETGQEFMSRYLAVDPRADHDNWGEGFRLKGVDATVYIYELKRALSRMAAQLDRAEEAKAWQHGAEKIKAAVLQLMWDEKTEMFFDVDPKIGQRTGVKAAVCFYPYFTDIVSHAHLSGLKKHLCNPNEFWTPFPAPSSSVDDPLFSAAPEWKGKRMKCPWNGRVWPMTNSHLAEALAQTAIRFNDEELQTVAVEFITKFIHMMFFDGDPRRPNCFEHYHPFTGKPALYRGVDDYQHSWINDLILKYVCGIRPHDEGVTISPFPFKLKAFVLDDIMMRGVKLKVERNGKKFRVWRNGEFIAKSEIGQTVELS
ncbi:hypothetical protein EDS67_03065 [candidate division KSB1 bacterium]|nr:MAG: hypothetical protein EDS67_03065 [candidate division KSB1 bacterium]MBC6949077.1 hypothetical protein [candidate division KSB1 bacterium]MCE7940865.1 hypothetical protein [Chlorobi bacterium CHB1]MDL1875093.1 hypothetical protein [Cytophagia bacterium CHB2]